MERVMGEAFDVLGESARVEGLDAGENLRVQLTPLLAGQMRGTLSVPDLAGTVKDP